MSKTAPKLLKKEAEKQKARTTFHFRILPTRKQTRVLEEWLGLCCEVYNAALDERRSAYRMSGLSLSYAHQCAELPECKVVRPELSEVPAQVLQDTVKRVSLAYDEFFRRVQNGETPGYPRFKSRARYDSLTFKQYGNSFQIQTGNKKKRGTLVIAKLGHVKMVVHRALNGIPKTAVVKRTPSGKWFVSISIEAEEAGREVARVNPAYTSQTCSACGYRQPMPLSVRIYECIRCGLVIDRDNNGSKNILEEALKAVGRHSRVIPEAPALSRGESSQIYSTMYTDSNGNLDATRK